MNKVNVLTLALSLLSISLFSCSTQENNREIIVNFDFDEDALSVEYDNNKTYLAGDNFTFKINLNENYELNEVIANNEKLVKRPSGEYIFSLIEYENNLKKTDKRKYFIFVYRFREFKSYSEISKIMDIDIQRISDEVKIISHFIEYSIRLEGE